MIQIKLSLLIKNSIKEITKLKKEAELNPVQEYEGSMFIGAQHDDMEGGTQENGIDLTKVKVPEFMSRLYAKFTARDYVHAVFDPKFRNKIILICVKWYLDFSSSLKSENFIAEYEEERKKLGFTMGKLTKPIDFNFKSTLRILKDDNLNSQLDDESVSTIHPLFKSEDSVASKKPKLKRINTARLNQLAKETREYKLKNPKISIPERVKSNHDSSLNSERFKFGSELQKKRMDRIFSNNTTMRKHTASKAEIDIEKRTDIVCMSKPIGSET